jgi:hypothetical protein
MADSTPESEEVEIEAMKADLKNAIDQCNKLATTLMRTYGAQIRDDAGKVDYFILYLKDEGIITEKQFVEFELKYHTMVAKSLNESVSELQAQERARGLIKPNQAKSRLVDGFGKPLT